MKAGTFKAGTFKERLRFYMTREGFTPTSLSKKAHLNMSAVRDILEHEETPKPRIDTFFKLCLALKVTPRQLYPEMEKLYPLRQRRLLDRLEEGKKIDSAENARENL